MKGFLKQVLAGLVALSLFFFLGLLFLGMILGTQEMAPPIEKKTLLTLDLQVPIADRPPVERFADLFDDALQGRAHGAYTLREVVTAIDEAAGDGRISGLFIKGNVVRDGYRSGWAALREVRGAIERFRASGKPVVTWQENLDEATLYVVSPANRIVLHPLGLVEFNGLAAEVLYFHDAFEKYGIGVQAVRAGRYKSAVEPFLASRMSDENREQLTALLDDFSAEMTGAIAASRGIGKRRLQAVSRGEGVLPAPEAERLGVVTAVAHYDEVLAYLKELTGTGADEPIERQIDVGGYFATLEEKGAKGKVAVIYAEGTILSGDDELEVGADRLARLLRKAREDETVKAVVLRINSPGGSASAADVIGREVELLREKKPLVASMGTVAASGGYWIAASADEIWVEPNSLTGSIGVFGLFFNVQRLAEEHGLNREVVRTSRRADFYSLFRPKTAEELATVQRIVDAIYDAFIGRVARGRGLEPARVKALAQGRVWSGKRALELGLADRAGGLREAIAAAAERAGLEEYSVLEYQRAESWADLLLRELGLVPEEGDAREPGMESLWTALRQLRRFTDPRGVHARMPFDLSIR